ncbi:hypothetical protein ACIPRD_31465 [Streptomyces sp. NPDC090108]|uniref:hypothetical protein n=1 Tax=Streptomyces sp. NPDC090108 TaxID=3365947 RepID=UPI0038175AAA
MRADACDAIYLGSFSKTLAPGLRVGWALAPTAVREKLVLDAESAMLSRGGREPDLYDVGRRSLPYSML